MRWYGIEAYDKEYFGVLRSYYNITLQNIADFCGCSKQSVAHYGNPLLYSLVLNMLIHRKEGIFLYDCTPIKSISAKYIQTKEEKNDI